MSLLDALDHPRLRTLYSFWDDRRMAGGPMPRAALDPVALPPALLGHLIVLDVLSGGADFRYRLVGTAIVETIGRDFTGESVSTYRRRHETEGVIDGYRHVCIHRAPHHYLGELSDVAEEVYRYERLALPMSRNGATVDQILAGFVFRPVAAETA
jgi:hypothetical protein